MSRIWDRRQIRRVMKTGASWHGFGRPAASRKWEVALPFRVRLGRGVGLVRVGRERGGTGAWVQMLARFWRLLATLQFEFGVL
jgi:hypothetical protein